MISISCTYSYNDNDDNNNNTLAVLDWRRNDIFHSEKARIYTNIIIIITYKIRVNVSKLGVTRDELNCILCILFLLNYIHDNNRLPIYYT